MSRNPASVSSVFITLCAALALGACSKSEAPRQESPADATAAAPAASTPQVAAPAASDALFKAFTIGALTADALHDGDLSFPNDNKVFGVGKSPDDVAAVLAAAGVATDKISVSIDPLLVEDDDKLMLFDTGAGNNMGPDAGHLMDALAAANIDPKRVTDIFLSHVHGDHVGGLVNAEGGLNFPNAVIHLSEPEWKFLSILTPATAANLGISNYEALMTAIKPKVDAFTPDAELIAGTVKAVAIPGHTPGHSGYMITSGEDSLFFVGDAMHSSIISVQKPEWPNGFDGDQAAAAQSREQLLEKSAADGQRLYVYHFPYPGIGKIEKQGDGYVWAAE